MRKYPKINNISIRQSYSSVQILYTMANIHIHTLGCRLNQAESEQMARQLKLAGHDIVTKPSHADYRIVNTCTVTQEAGKDSRKAARPSHPDQKIILTGCHSEMHPEDFEANLTIPNAEKEKLASLMIERFGLEGPALGMDQPPQKADLIYPLALKNTRAFVKIQDGCNMTCSFCLTTLARGISRSRPAPDILQEIQALADGGCIEAVLTGVHAGSYGLDIHQDLGWLIEQILNNTTIPRIRLSSLEPWNFKPHWMTLWKNHGQRLCRHLHMSLQSGCDAILPRMQRNYDTATFAEKINTIRNSIPEMALTTDIIVGFPGETDAQHQTSLNFVRHMNFSAAHIFMYSQRPGTKAADMPDQIPSETKKVRFQQMKSVIHDTEQTYKKNAAGQPWPILWEKQNKHNHLTGLTDTYLRVISTNPNTQPNTLTTETLDIDPTGQLHTQHKNE